MIYKIQVVSAEACFESGREDYGMPVASARLDTYKHRLQNLLDSYAISIVSLSVAGDIQCVPQFFLMISEMFCFSKTYHFITF